MLSAGRAVEGSLVVCAFRPLEPTGQVGGTSLAAKAEHADAQLLSAGLYDLCIDYRQARITRAQYAEALQDYASLVVQLAAYRGLHPEFREPGLSTEARDVEALIAHNAAIFALCRSPGFRSRLAGQPDNPSVGSFSRWCEESMPQTTQCSYPLPCGDTPPDEQVAHAVQ